MDVAVVPCEIEGEIGLDVVITGRTATVADLLGALQAAADDPSVLKPFHRERYACCAGCINNCCKYNSITPDLIAATAMAAKLRLDLPRFAELYLNLSRDLPYPEFRRHPCPFLIQNRCSVYAERALICRLYLCTPMTERLEQLRAAISFAGEAALKQRLVELGLAPANWSAAAERQALRLRRHRREISPEDYSRSSEQLQILRHDNPFSGGKDYETVRLVECCTDQLWYSLTADS